MPDKLKYIFFVTLFIFSLNITASRLKRAYLDLSIYNYFSAKNRFEKLLKPYPSAAAFGLSTIYCRNDNPFHNLDSAYTYILKSKNAYQLLNDKRKQKIAFFKIDSLHIDSLFKLICKNKFKKTLDSSDIDFFNHFIAHFKKAPQLNEAIIKRDELAFLKAKNMNTSDALCRFIETYPNALQVMEANRLYEKLLFLEKTKSGQLYEYVNFVEHYRDNAYKIIAEEKIFLLSTTDGTIKSYYEFIVNFPRNPHINTAWRNIYALYTKEFSKQKIIDFKKQYPQYPFLNELNEDIKLAELNYYPFEKDGKWGYINETGELLIDAKFQWASTFIDGFAIVQENNKKGFINKRGEYAIAPLFDDAENFQKGYAVVIRDNLYGLIDKTGKIKVPFTFSYLGEYSDSLIIAEKDGKYGYLDANGNTAIPFIYAAAGDFKNGFAYVKIAEKMGIINKNGINVLRCEYDWIENFSNNIARVKKDNLFGILNTKADTIVPMFYQYIGSFKNNLALLVNNNKYGYVNPSGKIVIPIDFTFDATVIEWADFNNRYALFKNKNKYGLIDTTGKKVIDAKYDAIGSLGKYNYLPVLQKDKWTYISLSKKQIPNLKFDYATSFNDSGLALVKLKNLYYVVNKNFELITNEGYEAIIFKNNFIQVSNENKYGILSLSAETIIPIECDKIEWIDAHIVKVQKENLNYLYNLKNKKNIYPRE